MTKPPRLMEVLNEPWWDPTKGKFSTSEGKLRLVYVEGGFDMAFFQRSTPRELKERIDFRIAGGKDRVIELVERDQESYGVVDMDFDFSDDQIDQLSIVATNSDCCLFWKLVREFGDGELQRLITKIINNLAVSGEASQLHERIHEDLTEIESRMKRATAKRLHRGYRSEYGGTFSEFESKFKEQIKESGVNDHDFEESIKNLFLEFGTNIESYKIQSQIKSHLLDTNHHKKSVERGKIATKLLKQL